MQYRGWQEVYEPHNCLRVVILSCINSGWPDGMQMLPIKTIIPIKKSHRAGAVLRKSEKGNIGDTYWSDRNHLYQL